MRVNVKEGDPSLAVQLDGADGAPRVRVTTPDGKTFESTPGARRRLDRGDPDPALRAAEDARSSACRTPSPGRTRSRSSPGSPAITKTTEAEDPPRGAGSTRVSASRAPRPRPHRAGAGRRVAAAGARRTLSYNIRSRPGQRVTFVEVGLGGRRVIGTTRGGRGKLTFTPAPGRDKRRIEAQFSLAGLRGGDADHRALHPAVAALGRPARVRVTRRGGSLQVSWPRVAGATRYDVVVTTRVRRTAQQAHRRGDDHAGRRRAQQRRDRRRPGDRAPASGNVRAPRGTARTHDAPPTRFLPLERLR